MADGDNKDVLQGISDDQKAVAEAQPEPVTGAEATGGAKTGEAETKTAAAKPPPAAAKKETPPAKT